METNYEIALSWGDLWDAMDKEPTRWFRTTEEMYNNMLEVLPPQDMGRGGFLVGEPNSHNGNGEAVYACFVEHANGEFEARYMTQKEFNAWKVVHK